MIKMAKSTDKSLKIRKEKKAKKPDFIRQDAHKKPRLGTAWRKPKGLQSKMRLQKSGYRAIVKTGYGSPKDARYTTRDGFEQVMVSNISELENIDPEKEAALIRSSVGMRNKIEMLKKAVEKKIKIIDIKDPEKFIKDFEEEKKSSKKEKEEKQQKREKKKKELEKEAEKKADKEKKSANEGNEENEENEEKTEEEKDKEKKEHDKLLTKKDSQ